MSSEVAVLDLNYKTNLIYHQNENFQHRIINKIYQKNMFYTF